MHLHVVYLHQSVCCLSYLRREWCHGARVRFWRSLWMLRNVGSWDVSLLRTINTFLLWFKALSLFISISLTLTKPPSRLIHFKKKKKKEQEKVEVFAKYFVCSWSKKNTVHLNVLNSVFIFCFVCCLGFFIWLLQEVCVSFIPSQ